MENYGIAPDEKEIEGWYFAVFTYLATNSRGSYTAGLDAGDGLVPFEGAELGPIIGKGSFGSVFRAVWGGKIVAIKVSHTLAFQLVTVYAEQLCEPQLLVVFICLAKDSCVASDQSIGKFAAPDCVPWMLRDHLRSFDKLQVIEFGDITRVDSEGDPLEASLMLSMKHVNIVETIQYTSQHPDVRRPRPPTCSNNRHNYPAIFSGSSHICICPAPILELRLLRSSLCFRQTSLEI